MAEAASGGALRELIAVFGFGVDTDELKKGENELEGFFGSLKKLAAGIAGVFAVKEVFEFAEANVHAMNQIERTATQLGVSTDRVQEFQFAAKSMGLESENLLNLMGRLQVSQQGAAAGSGQGAEAFRQLGISVKDSNGHFKSADELFLDVADGISKQTDASKQAAIATQLFGRQGRTILPLLKEGRKGVEDLGEEFKALGGGYTKEAIEESKKFEKQSARLDLAFTGLKGTISHALIPILASVVSGITSAVTWFRNITKTSDILRAAMLVLGTAAAAFAVQMTIAFFPFIAGALAIGAIILLVDDLIGLFTGKQSLIGETIDKVFGKGQSLAFVNAMKHAWQKVSDIIGDIKKDWEWLTEKNFISQWAGKFGDAMGKFDVANATALNDTAYAKQHGITGISGDQITESSPAWKRQKAGLSPFLPGPTMDQLTNGWGVRMDASSPGGIDININAKHEEGVVLDIAKKHRKAEKRAAKAKLPIATGEG